MPLFCILLGAFFLFYNSHWTLNFDFSLGFFWPAIVALFGLVLYMKKDRT